MNNLITFSDIQEHPLYYIEQIESNQADPFVIYFYGPWLALHYFEDRKIDRDKYIKDNPIFLYMIDSAYIINILNSNQRIIDIKLDLLRLAKECNSNNYDYSKKVVTMIYDAIDHIREYQYKSRILESALLNYSPIVPYSRTLVKPDMEKHIIPLSTFDSKVHYEYIDKLIERYLFKNILPIVENADYFVDNAISTKEELLKVIVSKESEDTYNAKIYYTLCILRYLMSEEECEKYATQYIKK